MERNLLVKSPVGEGVLGERNLLRDAGERDLRGDAEDLLGDTEDLRGDAEDLRGDAEDLRGDVEDRGLLCELSGASCRSLA